MHSTPLTRAPQPGVARPQILGLTGIRALAAAWVVVEHFRQPLFSLFPDTLRIDKFIEAGYLGVEVFFMLSGFIIAYTYAHQLERFSWPVYRRFMMLRFARIYPVHLITLLFVLFLVAMATIAGVTLNSSPQYTGLNFTANLFMLQAIPPFGAWNGPAWSICAEFFAYLAFPIIALWLGRIRTARYGLSAAALLLVCGAGLMLVTAEFVDPSATGYPLTWLRISIEFTAGALLYAGWRHLGSIKQGPWWDWAAVASVAGVICIIAVTDGDSSQALASVPLIGLFVLSCAGATGWVGHSLASKPMVWGGKISYSVYMTHFILLTIFGKIFPWDFFANDSFVVRMTVMTAYYVAVIIAGAACYYLVEEPARRIIRRATESPSRSAAKGNNSDHTAPVL